MPRRNRRGRELSPRSAPQQPATQITTTEDMARSLVRRGLASINILDRPHLAQKVTTK